MTLRKLTFLPILLLGLSGCQDALETVSNKVEHPLPVKLVSKMKANDMSTRSPIMMRIFKEESVLEVWKQKGNGRFDKIAEYQICKWSGKLGPKFKEGDRQAPEGHYRIYPAQMNPKSSYYLSFNMGYPNSYDRAFGRTGTNLMVHGACSSAGCYSMTDEQVLEIYGFARDAFKGGQEYFLVEALPFRMTPENMARHRNNENFEFWKMLKVGYDHFELTRRPPKVDICDRGYVFNMQPEQADAEFNALSQCPPAQVPATLASAHSAYEKTWNAQFVVAVKKLEAEDERRIAAETSKAEAEIARAETEAARLARAEAARLNPSPLLSLIPLPGKSRATAPLEVQPLTPDASAEAQAMTQDLAPVPDAAANSGVETAPAPAAGASATSDIPVASAPVPTLNPAIAEPQATAARSAVAGAGAKPFWKIWSKN